MKIAKKAAVTLAVAAAMFGGSAPASADHTTRDLCAGVVEYDGCWYCSYQQSAAGALPTSCHNGTAGHTWQYCDLWVTSACLFVVPDPVG